MMRILKERRQRHSPHGPLSFTIEFRDLEKRRGVMTKSWFEVHGHEWKEIPEQEGLARRESLV